MKGTAIKRLCDCPAHAEHFGILGVALAVIVDSLT
jgi:hypothetical protein